MAGWRVSPVLHLSFLPLRHSFFYAFSSQQLPPTMKTFTTAVALASFVPAIMSLTINTPYVLSASPTVGCSFLTLYLVLASSSAVRILLQRVLCITPSFFTRTTTPQLERRCTAILLVSYSRYSPSSSGMIF